MLILFVGQALHVLLEHLLELGREVVDRALPRQHGLAEARGQVAPVAGAVAVAAELVDRVAGAVRVIGRRRGLAGLLRRLGLRLPGLRRSLARLVAGTAALALLDAAD